MQREKKGWSWMAGENNFGNKFGKIKSDDCCLFWFEGTVYKYLYILGHF